MPTTFLDTNAEILAETIRLDGEEITYTSGGESVTLCALVGRQKFAADDDRGRLRIEYSDADFLVVVADLQLDGAQHTPKRRDQITWGDRTFEVAPFGDERHYRPADRGAVCWRIHAVEIQSP